MDGTRKLACIVIAGLLVAATGFFLLAAASGKTAGAQPGNVKQFNGKAAPYDPKKAPADEKAEDKKKNDNGGKPPAPDPDVDKWAVVIGISKYGGPGNDLEYCDEDAEDMYTILEMAGFPEGNIKMLVDKKAKGSAIMEAIDWMNSYEQKTTSECVFYFSGHCTVLGGDADGDGEAQDEAIVSTDLYFILDGQLREKFSTFTSQKIAFIIDACHAGGMDDLVSDGSGRILAAACEETQYSFDGSAGMQNGVFTHYFTDWLYGHIPPGGVYWTVEFAFLHADFPTQDYAWYTFGYVSTPRLLDEYAGEWTF